MRRDAQLILCEAQALTADAGSSNVLDLGVSRNIGAGNPLSVFIHVSVAADHTTGNETYNFIMQTDGDVAIRVGDRPGQPGDPLLGPDRRQPARDQDPGRRGVRAVHAPVLRRRRHHPDRDHRRLGRRERLAALGEEVLPGRVDELR
jgi:hypothetical protein